MQLLLVHSMLLLGVILPLGLLILWSRRLPIYRTLAGQRSESLAPLVVLLLGAALWSVAYALGLLARNPVVVQRLHQAAFTGVAFVPPTVLLVALALAFGYRASVRTWAALMALPVVSISLAWTNSLHGLIWASAEIVPLGSLTALATGEGPWFWIHTYFSYACVGVSVLLLGMRTTRVWAASHAESAALIAAVGVPWSLNALHLFTPTSPIDPTPAAVLVSTALLFGVVVRDRIKPLLPSAAGALFESSGDPMVLVDRDGLVVHSNPAGARLFVSPIDSTRGSALGQVWPGFDLIAGREGNHADLRLRDPSTGRQRDFDVRVYPGSADTESSIVEIVALRDITERREAEASMAQVAHYDEPTGLPNRRFFRENLIEALEGAGGNDQPVALIAIDVDGLKTVNDLHGQAAGDALILRVAEALRNAQGKEHASVETFPSRLGGDEFALLITGSSSAEEAEHVAARLQREVSASEEHEFTASLSMGIATFPNDGQDVSSLLRRADLALQAAKRQGRAQFRFFDRGMEKEIDRQATVSRALRKAIRSGDFKLLFQPKVDLATKRVCGLEALIRWTDAELGVVSPEEFIAIAERSGSIHGIGRWVLTETCQTLARWRAEGLGAVRVAVNVSAEELRDPNFGGSVFARLQEYQIDPSQIEIEITERSLLDEDIVMMTHLRDLRATGIRISLDDFGAGYSTLACISRVDLDSIKMDRSLIVDVELDGRATGVAAAVVTLARMFDMEVVAEGVETEEQEATLRELRCHQVQGYLYSRPVPADMVPELLGSELPLEKPTDP